MEWRAIASGRRTIVRSWSDAALAPPDRCRNRAGDPPVCGERRDRRRTGREVLDDLAIFRLRRYPHDLLLPRVWELQNNLTAYDAVYVALAEALEAPLLPTSR